MILKTCPFTIENAYMYNITKTVTRKHRLIWKQDKQENFFFAWRFSLTFDFHEKLSRSSCKARLCHWLKFSA